MTVSTPGRYWSRGDVALSITMSAMSTLFAVGMYPLLIFVFITAGLGTDGNEEESVSIPFGNVAASLALIIVPAIVGIVIKSKSERAAAVVERVGSALGVVFLVLACVAGVRDNPDLFDPSLHSQLWVLAALFQPLGSTIGFIFATAMRMDDAARVAVALETGVQNYALVMAVVSLSFTGCARTEAFSFVLIGSFFCAYRAPH